LRIFGAARDRIVSVEEVVAPFRGAEASHRTTLARFLVDLVVPAPEGAKPGSCLPYYPTDLPQIEAEITGDGTSDSAPPAAVPLVRSQGDTPSNAEMLIYTLSRQLIDGGVYTVGSVTPIAMVAYQLAKLTHAPNMAVIPFAGIVDVDFYPVAIGASEELALDHGYAFWGMEDLYELLYQSGRIDAEIFCPAQIDRYGDINNSLVFRDGNPVRLPGQAGIADVAAMHRNLYMYAPRHTPQRLTASLDFRGGSRYLVGDEERAASGFLPGEVTLVTDLCVLRQNKSTRLLEIESVHPGVAAADVIARTGFPLSVPSDPVRTVGPDRETLELLRNVVDPHGVRDVETVPSAQRRDLLHEILRHEAIQRKNQP
jgi:glutaconate CoA-transferase subunit A